MKTVRDALRDADPLFGEPDRLEMERDRLRQAVVAAASSVTSSSSQGWLRRQASFLAMMVLIITGIALVGSQIWPRGGTTLQAAIRFEVRLAEELPGAGLKEVHVTGMDRVIYLHQESVVTNDDIEQSNVDLGDGPSRFGVIVQFNAAGARKMLEATTGHIDKPMAILIDGEVVAVPTVRGPVSSIGRLSGNYTKAEAERIVKGIGLR